MPKTSAPAPAVVEPFAHLCKDVVRSEMDRLDRHIIEFAQHIEWLNGKPHDTMGKPYTSKRIADGLLGARRQLNTYLAMRSAINELIMKGLAR